jgi:hypothetical protein
VKLHNVHEAFKHLLVPLADLKPLDPNPNIGDVPAVMRSLEQFGQRKPIVVRKSDNVIETGNTTWAAMVQLGWTHGAAVICEDDEATSLAFALADNHTADLGKSDPAALAAVMERILETGDAALLVAASYKEKDLLKLHSADDIADTSPQLDMHYQILVECEDEQAQREMLDQLTGEGFVCRPITV